MKYRHSIILAQKVAVLASHSGLIVRTNNYMSTQFSSKVQIQFNSDVISYTYDIVYVSEFSKFPLALSY